MRDNRAATAHVMNSPAFLIGIVAIFASVTVAHAEDYGPLYRFIGWSGVGSVVLGIASTAVVAIKARRKWVWFLAPLFILVWVLALLAVIFCIEIVQNGIR
jgi:hypothetical protein